MLGFCENCGAEVDFENVGGSFYPNGSADLQYDCPNDPIPNDTYDAIWPDTFNVTSLGMIEVFNYKSFLVGV